MRNLFAAVAFLLFVAAQANATDLTITAANVKVGGSSAVIEQVTYGEAVTAGQPVYLKDSDGLYYKADNDASSETAEVRGIALVGNSTSGVGVIVTRGPITIGATVTAGMNYVASSTAGGIAPVADLGSNDYITSLGHAISTTVLYVDIKAYGVQVP